MHRLLTVTAFALALTGLACKSQHPYQWVSEVPQSDAPVESVPLRPGDQIGIQVQNWQELSVGQTYQVNADGAIVLPLIGLFKVEGLTAAEVAKRLDQRLNGIIIDPNSRVSVVTPRIPVITVLGEVRTPGRFEVAHGEGVLPALALAGGLTEFADDKSIYVVRTYPSRQRIRFRYEDLVGGHARSVDFQLRDGDVIVVE